jgi:hypothetical protein
MVESVRFFHDKNNRGINSALIPDGLLRVATGLHGRDMPLGRVVDLLSGTPFSLEDSSMPRGRIVVDHGMKKIVYSVGEKDYALARYI